MAIHVEPLQGSDLQDVSFLYNTHHHHHHHTKTTRHPHRNPGEVQRE